MTIYCDIDGVLANFHGFLAETMNKYAYLAETIKNLSITYPMEPFLTDLTAISFAARETVNFKKFKNTDVNNQQINKKIQIFAEYILANNEYWWTNIPLLPDSHKLVNIIQYYDKSFKFLTAPFDEISKNGKLIWIANNFKLTKEEAQKKVIFEKEKWHYANPNSILIDDTEENVNKFRIHGGLAIHHGYKNNINDTIKELCRLFPNRFIPSSLLYT